MLSTRVAIFLIVAAVALDVASAQVNYCVPCANNTLCKYPVDGPSAACGATVIAYGVDAANQKIVLDMHNQLRSKVAAGLETRGSNGAQPGATNMRTMVWNAEIANLAQRWVNQCAYSHDTCRDIPSTTVGQNIAYTTYSSIVNKGVANWTDPITMWFHKEVPLWNKTNINPFTFVQATSHYTQMTWAETNQLGCGFIYYKDVLQKYPYKAYYACNYGPAGNFFKAPMYKTGGAPCSQCTNTTAVCVNSLCT